MLCGTQKSETPPEPYILSYGVACLSLQKPHVVVTPVAGP